MITLYHGITAHAHPTSVGHPTTRTDCDNIIIRLNRDQALGLIGEILGAFSIGAGDYYEVNLVIEDASPLIWKQSYFEGGER